MVFAPDGTIFLSTGDAAASSGEKPESLRAQDLDAIQGKILRISPAGLERQ